MYPCTSWHIIWMKYHILQLFISQLHSAAASEVNNGADKQPMMEELQRQHRGTSSDKTLRGRRRRLWKAAGIWTDSMMDTPRWQQQPHSVLSAFFKRWQILDILCKKPQSSLQHWHFSVCFRWCFSPLWFCFPAGTFAQVSVTSSVWMFTGHTDAYRLKTILCSAEACTTHPGCLYVIWLH